MHRLIETTFRESLASNRRCLWVSGTDATKPVTTTPFPHHLPKFLFPTFPGFLPAPASGPDLLCSGLELPKTRGQSGPQRAVLDPDTCFLLLFKMWAIDKEKGNHRTTDTLKRP